MRDLSKFHKVISDFVKWPETTGEWDQYRLSKEQIGFYKEFGYLSGIKLFEEWQVEVLQKELTEITKPSHPGNSLFHEFHSNESKDPNTVLFHALGAWRIMEGFHDMLWNPAFVMAASQLLGDVSVRFWHDQLFSKPAKHGGVVAWHQDYSYWTRTGPMAHLTCWIGLDDSSKANGCLHYIPKSHNWGLLEMPSLAGDMFGLKKFLNDEQKVDLENEVAIEMPKGYATFHHPLLVHGSYENRSELSRRATVLNVFTDGTESKTDGELLPGIPIIKNGDKMDGQFFPLLFEPV